MTTERTVLVIQHQQCEGLGTIAESLTESGVAPRYVRAYAGDPVPDNLGGTLGVIVMGGPMGVYEQDRFPFLGDEMRLFEAALRAGKPALGICLGSQLLAQVLGAQVRPAGRKEIGWFDVSLADSCRSDPLWQGIEPRFNVFHWHGDVFPLPAGAVHLASSALTPHQAFRYGATAYGILFHLEATQGIIDDMLRAWPEELRAERLDAGEIANRSSELLGALRHKATRVLGRWVNLLDRD